MKGSRGARAAIEDTLRAEDKTLRSFLSLADLSEVLGARFFEEYTRRRIKKGYALHALRTYAKDWEAFASNPLSRRYVTSNRERREIRYIKDDFSFPVTIYIYDHKLCMISSRKEAFAAILESNEVAAMQRALFSMLWERAEPETQSLRRR